MSQDVPVDDNGCPTEMLPDNSCSKHCPAKPCNFCTGNSSVPHRTEQRLMTGWEWCQGNNVCAATIDWELIFQGR